MLIRPLSTKVLPIIVAKWLLLGWGFYVFLLLSTATSATSSVIISEIYPQPKTGEVEWIEIHNPTQESITISGWYLMDTLSTPSIMYTFPADTLLLPNAYLVASISAAKLNNSGDGVTLFSQESIIHEMSYTTSAPSVSWQLGSSGWCQSAPTPGSANSCPQPTPSPTATPPPSPNTSESATTSAVFTVTADAENPAIPPIISEVSPCPADNKEWVEFYNPSSTAVSFTNVIITDAQHNQRSLSGYIRPKEYAVVFLKSAMLNNAGDQASITWADGTLLAFIEYEDCFTDETLSLINGTWQWGVPTPLLPNLALATSISTLDSATTTQLAPTNATVSATKPSTAPLKIADSAPQTSEIESRNSTPNLLTLRGELLPLALTRLALPKILAGSASLPINHTTSTTTSAAVPTDLSQNQASIDIASTQSSAIGSASLVIMGGLLLILTSTTPDYDTIQSFIGRLFKRSTTTPSLGWADLLSQ